MKKEDSEKKVFTLKNLATREVFEGITVDKAASILCASNKD
jgi:hypothetical protein